MGAGTFRMMRGLGRWSGRRSTLWTAALVAIAGCGSDPADGGTSGAGGSRGDASIEDAADGDGSVDEQDGGAGGSGGTGGGGSGGTGGESGTGDSGEGGQGGESGGSGDGGTAGGAGDEPDASIEGDAGEQDAVCFGGGVEQTSSASGACDSPIVIDMRELAFGDVVFFQTSTETTNGLVPSIDKCADGTGRDVVFNVQVPDATDLEVSVEATDASDPIILVQDGPDLECDKSDATLCVDDTAVGECEYLRVLVSAVEYEGDTPQVVIAETQPSGAALTVRFRLADPGGGS